jgi:hypothetical protein
MINWNITKEDMAKVTRIVKRVRENFGTEDFKTLGMDITACHLNGCPLDLDALLVADIDDFYHDIGGITHHIDRNTGALQDCFLPRFAA